jgi:hypothetical protein
MNKLYLRIMLLLGLIESCAMIILGWTITREMVNLRVDLRGQINEYFYNRFVNTIIIGDFMIIFGIILIIIFYIMLVNTEKIDRI